MSIGTSAQPLRIATRQSPLALWQAHYVANELRRHHPGLVVELVSMVTQGDKILDVPLAITLFYSEVSKNRIIF